MADTEPTTVFEATTSETLPKGHNPFQFTTLENNSASGAGPERTDLVNLTNPAYTGSAPLKISTLELSALGANAEIAGDWNASYSDTITWRDLGQGGRTVKSMIVQRGYLFPLGHRAVIQAFFERVFAVDPGNASPDAFPVGYLQMRIVLRVAEPTKTYGSGTVGEPFTTSGFPGSLDWPFQQVRMITLKSPDLNSAVNPLYETSNQAVWPTYGTPATDVHWTFVATDLAGRDVTLSMPLAFVYGAGSTGQSEFATGSFTDDLCRAYRDLSLDSPHLRYSEAGGVPLKFAPESGGVIGGTTHPALSIMLGAATSTLDFNTTIQPSSPGAAALKAAGQPNFYPVIRRARIRLHAAEVLTGQSQDQSIAPSLLPVPTTGGGIEVNYCGDYVSGDLSTYGSPTGPSTGAPANPGAVYLAITNSLNLSLPANKVGGIGTPNTQLSGLSATAGAVGGSLVDANGSWVPGGFAASAPQTEVHSYFPPSLDPQLLGGLTLSDILGPNFTMPTITSQSLPAPANLLDVSSASGSEAILLSAVRPELDDVTTGTDPSTGAHTVTYSLNTGLQTTSVFFPDSDDAMLTMTTVVSSTPGVGATPTYTTNGTIDPFKIELAGILSLHFESVSFSSGTGQSTSVAVNLDTAEFIGCLSFVNTLEQFLSSLGLGGVAIDVQPTQVTVGISLALPDIEVGVFSLSGIAFKVGAVIPFLGGQSVATFAFASSDNPFTLVFACFGGGGFVSLACGFGGLQTLQAQFEVEGQAGIDIVVASGSVSLSVGIYYSYSTVPTAATSTMPALPAGANLSGFVQLAGQVELLGFISVSITLNISLTWEITAGAVQGTATLRVSVSICGFGVSIPITVSKSFGGASAPASAASFGGVHEAELIDVIKSGPVGAVPQGTSIDELPPPIFRTQPITFDQVVTSADWRAYCAAFSTAAVD